MSELEILQEYDGLCGEKVKDLRLTVHGAKILVQYKERGENQSKVDVQQSVIQKFIYNFKSTKLEAGFHFQDTLELLNFEEGALETFRRNDLQTFSLKEFQMKLRVISYNIKYIYLKNISLHFLLSLLEQ